MHWLSTQREGCCKIYVSERMVPLVRTSSPTKFQNPNEMSTPVTTGKKEVYISLILVPTLTAFLRH